MSGGRGGGGDFLEQMARGSRERLEQARRSCSDAELRALALATPSPPPLALSPEGFDLIAEVKLRSPASGALRPGGVPLAGGSPGPDGVPPAGGASTPADEDLRERVRDYAAAGAAAISVLTEPSRFDGELAHLAQAVGALGAAEGSPAVAGQSRCVPVMRKDFLVDPYQIYEARAAGAGGALVILRLLSREAQQALIEACAEVQLFALLEAFDEHDLVQAAELVSRYRARLTLLVGINCRDLGTLQVVPGRLEALAHVLPAGVPHVAESGVEGGADAARLARAGYEVALVGSALMRAGAPGALAREILTAGRQARSAAHGAVTGAVTGGVPGGAPGAARDAVAAREV
jgi:indole-3-glycerol phosphate synthase